MKYHPMDVVQFLRTLGVEDHVGAKCCWLWGQDRTWVYVPRGLPSGRKALKPDRFAYEVFKGVELDDDAQFERTCGVKDCVNPNHLRLKDESECLQESTSQ